MFARRYSSDVVSLLNKISCGSSVLADRRRKERTALSFQLTPVHELPFLLCISLFSGVPLSTLTHSGASPLKNYSIHSSNSSLEMVAIVFSMGTLLLPNSEIKPIKISFNSAYSFFVIERLII